MIFNTDMYLSSSSSQGDPNPEVVHSKKWLFNPLQVNFSEPLSMLQRLTEEFEYSKCLDKAAKCEDSCEQLAYVAAFTISAYASTTSRTGKPFNPLLGETYECDRRDDYGWKAFAEQVSLVITSFM